MKQMKLCILSTEQQWEIGRIKETAERRGHETCICQAERDCFTRCLPSHLLVRAIRGAVPECRKIASEALTQGAVVVDERVAHGITRNKFANYERFIEHGLWVPAMRMLEPGYFGEIKKFPSEYIVIKDVSGKRGEGIYRCKRMEFDGFAKKLLAKKENSGKKFLAQEFVEIEKEFRVFVIGGMALGAFSKKTEGWLHNVAKGAEPVKETLTPELAETAVKAAQVLETEIAGVDIGITKRGLFVLEVNRSPQFRGFEKATGINVAEEIVKYIEGK